jgi:hypothetical protein
MVSKKTKIIITVLLVLSIVGIAVGVYFGVFNKKSNSHHTIQPTNQPTFNIANNMLAVQRYSGNNAVFKSGSTNKSEVAIVIFGQDINPVIENTNLPANLLTFLNYIENGLIKTGKTNTPVSYISFDVYEKDALAILQMRTIELLMETSNNKGLITNYKNIINANGFGGEYYWLGALNNATNMHIYDNIPKMNDILVFVCYADDLYNYINSLMIDTTTDGTFSNITDISKLATMSSGVYLSQIPVSDANISYDVFTNAIANL